MALFGGVVGGEVLGILFRYSMGFIVACTKRLEKLGKMSWPLNSAHKVLYILNLQPRQRPRRREAEVAGLFRPLIIAEPKVQPVRVVEACPSSLDGAADSY